MHKNLIFPIFAVLLFAISLKADTYQAPKASSKDEKNIIAGIALIVNGSPITIYEIEELKKTQKTTTKDAIEILIGKALREEQLRKFDINITQDMVDLEIANIAKKNKITQKQLLAKLSEQGITFSKYQQDIKNNLQTQAIAQKILAQNMQLANEGELRQYYDANKKDFLVPQELVTIRYLSNNRSDLEKLSKDKKLKIQGVKQSEETLQLSQLPPEIMQIFITIKKDTFTPILNDGSGSFVMFYIKDRLNLSQVPFEQVKNFIAQTVMLKKQDKILGEYFAKLRLRAKINIIRQL